MWRGSLFFLSAHCPVRSLKSICGWKDSVLGVMSPFPPGKTHQRLKHAEFGRTHCSLLLWLLTSVVVLQFTGKSRQLFAWFSERYNETIIRHRLQYVISCQRLIFYEALWGIALNSTLLKLLCVIWAPLISLFCASSSFPPGNQSQQAVLKDVSILKVHLEDRGARRLARGAMG